MKTREDENDNNLKITYTIKPSFTTRKLKQLQQENKILKENAEINDKVVYKINWDNQLLKKENKKLQCYKNKFLLTKLYIIEKMREINPENLNLNDLNDKLDDKEFCYYFTYFLILQKIKEIEFEEDSKGE